MAQTYSDLYNIMAAGTPGALEVKATIAIWKAAYDVTNESAGTANHTARLAWANKVGASFDAAKSEAKKMLVSLLQNATIQTNGNASTDSDVQFVVNSLIDKYSAL